MLVSFAWTGAKQPLIPQKESKTTFSSPRMDPFFSQRYDDINESDFFELPGGSKTRNKRGGGGGATRRRRRAGGGGGGGRSSHGAGDRNKIVDVRGRVTKGRRAKKKRICSDSTFSRVPHFPIPPTWAHTVEPFKAEKERSEIPSHSYMEMDIKSMEPEMFEHKYTAILMDAPFALKIEKCIGMHTFFSL